MPQNEYHIVVPEVLIFNVIKNALFYLRQDYATNLAASTETNSLLYRIIEANKIQRYVLFDQAKSIFITPENANEPKYLDISMGYDTDRIAKKNPTIHLIVQSDSPKNNMLGLGSGANDPDFYSPETVDGTGLYREYHKKGFAAQVNLIISGENSNEKIMIYHILRSLLISYIPYFENQGLFNIEFNGGDIQINTGVAGNIFMRNLTMSFDYYVDVPHVEDKEYISKIFYELRLVNEDGTI